MSIKTGDLPYFITHTRNYLKKEQIDFYVAHKKLIHSISKLYMLGYKYEEVVACKSIKQARDTISMHYSCESKYPYNKSLINFIYTRDQQYNSLGKWIEFDYLEPLLVLEFAQNILKKSKSSTHPGKLASLIFTLFQTLKVAKKYRRDEAISYLGTKDPKLLHILNALSPRVILYRFDAPSHLYSNASINQISFKKYAKFLEVEHHYQRHVIEGEKYTRMWLWNTDKLIRNFKNFSFNNRQRYKELYYQIEQKEISGINLIEKATTKRLMTNYKNNLIRTAFNKFDLPTLKFAPLIFLKDKTYTARVVCQQGLMNYNILLQALYSHPDQKKKQQYKLKPPLNDFLKGEDKDVIRRYIYTADIVSLNKLTDSLKEGGFYNNPKPISSPINKIKGKHFEQIDRSFKVINKLSETGIRICLTNLYDLLGIKQNMLKKLELKGIDPLLNLHEQIIKHEDLSEKYLHQISLSRKLTNEIRLLKSMSVSAKGNRGNSNNRIYGLFTPHGANTHRMTCKRINLQGIPKGISHSVLTAPDGWSLVSADVSGQDIVVAANLAQKLYSKPDLFEMEHHQKLGDLKNLMNRTISKLKCNNGGVAEIIAKPVDFITQKILAEENIIIHSLTPAKLGDYVRDEVKTCIYTLLYGGGRKTLESKLIPSFDILIEKIKFLIKRMEALLKDCKLSFSGSSDEINRRFGNLQFLSFIIYELNALEKIITFAELYNGIISMQNSIEECDVNSDYLSEFTFLHDEVVRIYEQHKARMSIFDSTLKFLDSEYTGILDVFYYLQKYYERNRLTYPTLLGWQTVIDDLDQYGSLLITRSKSYVIQASGAEFIRQWLIELSQLNSYNKSFKIVNAIHDQVILEVKNESISQARSDLIKSAKKAAVTVGIDPDTLHLKDSTLGVNSN
ncbi:MAG: DNA polymerase [Bacteroidetes bacterium]|nr:DNA polymerase [Bacteroidota bacterium]